MARTPVALVLGTAFRGGPRTCRSLRRAGLHVVGADEPGLLAGRSLDLVSPLRCPRAAEDPEGFAAWLAATCARLGPVGVIATDEDMARLAADVVPGVPGAAMAGADAAQFAALCDKAGLRATAAAAGVAVPAGVVAPRDAPAPPRWPSLPSVVKPVTSGEGNAAKAVRVEDAAARAAAVAALHGTGSDALVEEWLDGAQTSVHAVRDRHGVTLTVTARVHALVPRSAGTPSLMVTGPAPAARAAAVRLLDAVDYRGPANLQFLDRDGEPAVHDVNLRIGAGVAMAVRAGLDVPARAVLDALGRRLPPPPAPRDGVVYLCPLDEASVAREALLRGDVGEAARILGRVLSPRRGTLRDPRPLDPFPYAQAALRALRRLRRLGG